jgi:hypothetical protein
MVFTAKDGFVLKSSSELELGSDYLYVRGSNTGSDEKSILIPKDGLDRILDAVSEYNKAYGNADTVSLRIPSDEPISLRMDA